MKRDFITIDSLGTEALLALMDLADRIRTNLRGHVTDLGGVVMGSLFLEPSTRTRLSFETAMLRLGGKVVTSSDARTASSSKGETLADTVRIVDSYVDLTVLRHPAAGAARLAAKVAQGSIINAGDGAHEHPTQTLCDLYALRCEKGRIRDLTVALYGDLKYGRTTHSLARALVRVGATILAISEGELRLPSFVLEDLSAAPGYGVQAIEIDDMETVFRRQRVPAMLIAPKQLLPASPDSKSAVPFGLKDRQIDAIYVTRLQKERLLAGEGSSPSLPILDHRFLTCPTFEASTVLHPLPRVQEIAAEIDTDPRAAYFRQAALGVPIRMALLLWSAGAVELPLARNLDRVVPAVSGYLCTNPGCISVTEGGSVAQEIGAMPGAKPRCLFCEELASPQP